MSDDKKSSSPTRRTFIETLGGAGLATLIGCGEQNSVGHKILGQVETTKLYDGIPIPADGITSTETRPLYRIPSALLELKGKALKDPSEIAHTCGVPITGEQDRYGPDDFPKHPICYYEINGSVQSINTEDVRNGTEAYRTLLRVMESGERIAKIPAVSFAVDAKGNKGELGR